MKTTCSLGSAVILVWYHDVMLQHSVITPASSFKRKLFQYGFCQNFVFLES